ncbi:hypothetical protein BH11ACT3_BH11ACT3_10120 [soil metagenome]
MPQAWSDTAEERLLDHVVCPRCESEKIVDFHCSNCGADLSGPVAAELWQASMDAAVALRARQAILDRVPVREAASVASGSASIPLSSEKSAAGAPPPPVGSPLPGAAPASPPPPSAPLAPAAAAAAASTSQITVQSVLAVAGAGLFGVAAIVFAFFNPELSDFRTRTAIIGVSTALFLGGAWLLARRRLQFSAEAVGALGMVFVALDIWAFSQKAPPAVDGWVFVGIGTLVSGAVMFAAALLARIRSWLWISVIALAIVPLFFGLAGRNAWPLELGYLGVAFASVGLAEIVRRATPRFSSPLMADRTALTVVRVIAVLLALRQLVDLPGGATERALGTALVLMALATVAASSAHQQLRLLWSFATGALFVLAVGVLPFALDLNDVAWYIVLSPVAASIGVLAIGLLPAFAGLRRGFLIGGGLTVALVAVAPALLTGGFQVLSTMVRLVGAGNRRDLTIAETFAPATDYAAFGESVGLGSMLGIAAVAGAIWLLAVLVSRRSPLTSGWPRGLRTVAIWLGAASLLVLSSWSALSRPVQVGIALLLALGLCALVRRVPGVDRSPLSLRVPLIVGAHTLLVLAAVISWADANVTVFAGVAIVTVTAAAARTVPAVARPVYLGVGYAYALIIFATALDIAHVETIALLCLTTTLASLVGIAATLTRWLSARSWYAVLVVTAVPFLIGVISVLIVRSGWTALSTGVTFALALALLLTRREGMTRLLRTGAATLLVPSLAVVIISLGAQVLEVSGSPITLPVIAVIVACVLPSTGLIASALVRHGISDVDARAARIGIEASALVTAALAVVLALVRAAAGLDTSFLVLMILGVGAIATAIWGKRRYAWWVAGASFTGALWCVWALAGIDIIEPYLLPPALSAAIIGGVLVLRGTARGIGLYATGLIVAAVPTVVILAVSGNGVYAVFPWRSAGLLVASFLLLVLGSAQSRRPKRFVLRAGPLAAPTLAVSILTAAAGAIQAVRWGRDLDPLRLSVPSTGVFVILGLSVGVAGLAAVAARQLLDTPAVLTAARLAAAQPTKKGAKKKTTPSDVVTEAVTGAGERLAASRWLYVPAMLYLVAGPIAAITPAAAAIWITWGLMVALLLLVVFTTARERLRLTTLPPVWFTWAVAFVVAVVAWSPREILRVEGFSLPLGGFLLLAGIVAMLPLPSGRTAPTASFTSWPIGPQRTFVTLAPGIIACFLASVVATGTDPQTWRAILVIAMALAAILIGSVLKLRAPFIIGLVVLPIEIIIVFAAQIGRNIESVPWWITLAVAGALLLILAVTNERREGQDGSIAARMRDLR